MLAISEPKIALFSNDISFVLSISNSHTIVWFKKLTNLSCNRTEKVIRNYHSGKEGSDPLAGHIQIQNETWHQQ